jgi:hypothetical protein
MALGEGAVSGELGSWGPFVVSRVYLGNLRRSLLGDLRIGGFEDWRICGFLDWRTGRLEDWDIWGFGDWRIGVFSIREVLISEGCEDPRIWENWRVREGLGLMP